MSHIQRQRRLYISPKKKSENLKWLHLVSYIPSTSMIILLLLPYVAGALRRIEAHRIFEFAHTGDILLFQAKAYLI
jgi:hypothetical protein